MQAAHIPVLARREERRQIQPFSDDILAVIVPHDFREPVMESYDGTGDPNEHLTTFDLQMIISNGSDAQKCKMFGDTLKGMTLAWFTALPMRSIQSFDLSAKFLTQFAANRAKKFMEDDMHDVKQKPGETLKEYLARFNAATMKVVDPDQKTFVSAFMKGVRSGPFNESLNQRRPTSLDEIRGSG